MSLLSACLEVLRELTEGYLDLSEGEPVEGNIKFLFDFNNSRSSLLKRKASTLSN